MGTLSKRRKKSIKLTPGKRKQIRRALTLLTEHYAATLKLWEELQPAQRAEVLAHSPLLADLAALTAPLRESEHGY